MSEIALRETKIKKSQRSGSIINILQFWQQGCELCRSCELNPVCRGREKLHCNECIRKKGKQKGKDSLSIEQIHMYV
jgi:hypothetical protein